MPLEIKKRRKEQKYLPLLHLNQETAVLATKATFTLLQQAYVLHPMRESLSFSASSICHWGTPLCLWPRPCGWALVRLFWVLNPKVWEIEWAEDLGTKTFMAEREGRETDAWEISVSSWIFRPPLHDPESTSVMNETLVD